MPSARLGVNGLVLRVVVKICTCTRSVAQCAKYEHKVRAGQGRGVGEKTPAVILFVFF